MKVLFLALFFTASLLPCYANSGTNVRDKVSLRTVFFLTELEENQGKVNEELAAKYNLLQIKGTYYAGGLMMVDKNTIEPALTKWSAKANTRAGNIFSIKVPVANLVNLLSEQAITYFELDNKVYSRMDSVRRITGVDIVQQGLGLPQGYTGKGVVFADIDGGFDYTHPNFFDSTGTNYRVKRVWDQNTANTVGQPPVDFNYGVEFANTSDILDERFSDSTGTHGTHVTGIAAGSGANTGGRYKGIAPESDIVLVALTNQNSAPTIADVVSGTTSGLLDAINYTFLYAQQEAKPAVINMSLGLHIGPHDGTSLFDQACDALVGPGQILVGANGNEGGLAMHYSTNFSGDTATRLSYVGFQGNSGLGLLNAWGDFGTDFCMNLYLASNVNTLGRICASQNYNGSVWLTSSTNDTCFVRIATAAKNAANNKPEILVEMLNRQVATGDTLIIELSSGKTGLNGKVHIWNGGAGNGAVFYGTGFAGDNSYTMGEIGGTGKSIISVGAFTSKNEYTNIAGENQPANVSGSIGSIASFSSRGPTVDGRTKPDITAPGNVIVSSISSFDKRYQDSGTLVKTVIDTVQLERTWGYATLFGTSMATPCVAGIVALLLEAKPNLTQAQIKTILQDNATRDKQVVLAGTVPNNTFGYGKVNALQAMRTATPVNEIASPNRMLLYPNPAQGYVTLITNDEPMQLNLCDLTGRQLLSRQTTGGTHRLDISTLSAGVYMLHMQQGSKVFSEKLVVE